MCSTDLHTIILTSGPVECAVIWQIIDDHDQSNCHVPFSGLDMKTGGRLFEIGVRLWENKWIFQENLQCCANSDDEEGSGVKYDGPIVQSAPGLMEMDENGKMEFLIEWHV